jgi:alpha-galactosidase
MTRIFSITICFLIATCLCNAQNNVQTRINKKPLGINRAIATKPPMGWNSFDAYDCRINEQEFKSTVDFMHAKLLKYGWEYAVIDYVWFNDEPGKYSTSIPGSRRFGHPNIRLNTDGKPLDTLVMDEYGRLLPSISRFPSAKNGKGFKAIADYVHSKGMKFGIHIMRGIPREAYYNNLPIKGTKYTAKDIAEPWDTCSWQNNLFGVDASKPGAQEYYNSIFELYAEWEVDFIKADDMMYPPYHKAEIEMISKALANCGRPMVLSLSCGEAPLSQAEHVATYSHMWRISADFWDKWESLKHNFDLMNAWSPFIKTGQWPDADMLPIGRLSLKNRPHGPERMSKFTVPEHYTLMTLWSIARSPLMLGADLLKDTEGIMPFLTNVDVLNVNQNSTDNRQVFKNENYAIWIAIEPGTKNKYVALFNLSEKERKVSFDLELENLRGKFKVKDLWKGTDKGLIDKSLESNIPPHGAAFFKLTPF